MASKTATIKAVVLGDVDNFKRGMKEVGESAEEAGDKVRRDLNSSLDDIGEGAGGAEQKFIGLSDSISGTQDVMEGLRTGNVAQLAMGFADLAGAVESLWTSVVKSVTALWGKVTALAAEASAAGTSTVALVAHKVATWASEMATKAWAAAQWVLNAALNANPIMLVVLAVGALVAAFVLAYKNVDWFRNAVDAVARFFVDTFWPILQTVGGWIGTAFVTYIGLVIDSFRWLWDMVQNYAMPVLSVLADWIGTYFVTQFNVARTAIGWVIDRFQDAWSKAIEVKDGITGALDTVVGFISGLSGRISNVASGMFDGIKDAFRSAINWVIGGWNGLAFSFPSFDTKIPGVGRVGGFSVGTPDIPYLAQGGLVKGGQGGTLAMIGEGRSDELVVPLDRAGRSGLGNVYVTVNAPVGANARTIGRQLQRYLNEYGRAS